LKSWSKQKYPLAYGVEDGHEIFDLLVRAVVHDEASLAYGLPGWDSNSQTPFALVNSLLDMSSPVDPSTPSAPVVKNGAFLPVLKVAHSSIIALATNMDKATMNNFLQRTFRNAITIFKINFFPSHKENTRTPGARHRIAVYNSWGWV
jgi:hypothetical protein